MAPSIRIGSKPTDKRHKTSISELLFLLRDTTAFDREAFALSLVAGTVVYLAAEIRFAMKAKIPYVVTDENKAGSR